MSASAPWWSGHSIFNRNILGDPRDPLLQSSWEQRKIIDFIYLPLKPASVVPGKGVLGALCERPGPYQRRLCMSITSSLLRQKLVWENGGSQRRSSSGWRNKRAQEIQHQSSEMRQQFHWSCSGCLRGPREMGFYEHVFLERVARDLTGAGFLGNVHRYFWVLFWAGIRARLGGALLQIADLWEGDLCGPQTWAAQEHFTMWKPKPTSVQRAHFYASLWGFVR